ncbi:MAG: ABC transporter substrate-binding protein, partial [Acidobacteriota bacterium]
VIEQVQADLIHLHRQRQTTVGGLAESWTVSDDGRRYRLTLRRDVHFSDGEPFDADDVVFTFGAILDPEVGSPQIDTLRFDGEPITAEKIDRHTVDIVLPIPYAGGEDLFDGVFVLPEHRLGEAWREGTLASAWSAGTAVDEIVGLGPFRLAEVVPGERIVLERNPHYWRRDAEGGALPYLDRLIFNVVADDDAQTLRFQAGESHLIEGLSSDLYARLAQAAESADVPFTIADLGPGLVYEFLFWNLNDLPASLDPERAETLRRRQGWFRQIAFRRAVSLAIDRGAIASLVYRGRATPVGGHITPANRRWHDTRVVAPAPAPQESRHLLTEAGFTWDAEGRLIDPDGVQVTFTIVTNASNPRRVQTATVVQDDLARIGIEIQTVPLDFGGLLDRVYDTFDYDVGLLGLGRGGTDPNSALNVWLSTGDSHLWHFGDGPTTEWEARLDELLQRQMVELDADIRREQVAEIQRLVADQLPYVFLVAPNVLVGAHRDLGNFAPAVLDPSTLWNSEHLFWRDAERRGSTTGSGPS